MARWTEFKPLFEALEEGVVISGAGGVLLYMNPAAENLLGVKSGTPESANACSVICGRLYEDGPEPCSAQCPLREPGGGQDSVCFLGRYESHSAFEWRDFQIRRSKRWIPLRVRCLRFAAPGEPEEHLTLIARRGEEAGPGKTS